MSERRLTKAERARIGRELVAARAAGVDWKTLMRRYQMGRTRLWMLWREALEGRDRQKDVHEHRGCGQPGPATRYLTAA